MTESEWNSCTDPIEMLNWLQEKGLGSDRKLRLFAVACCRRVWPWLTDDRCTKAVSTAERYADGLATEEELLAARQAADDAGHEELRRTLGDVEREDVDLPLIADVAVAVTGPTGAVAAEGTTVTVADIAALMAEMAVEGEKQGADWGKELAVQAGGVSRKQLVELLREFVNPFGPASIAPACQNPEVISLAMAIYEERAFDRLPFLADALEDAGCTNASVLGHLRGPGPHFRGCYALDAILGKT